MTDPQPPSDAEPVHEVGRPGSFLIGCAIGLCALLGVGVIVVVRGKRIEDRKRATTLERLNALAQHVRNLTPRSVAPPPADGTGEDWTGLDSLAKGLTRAYASGSAHPGRPQGDGPEFWYVEKTQTFAFRDADLVGAPEPTTDGWDHPIRYRSPGVVHKKGWDFYSCGPNGKDDQGTFDDLVVGEDVAPPTSQSR